MEKILNSAKELRKLRTIVTLGMLGAVAAILGIFTVQAGENLKIGFSFIANEMAGFLFGPVCGGLFSGVADIVKMIVNPTGGFFPGFTISSILGGIIFGFVLYKEPLSFKRVLLANFLVAFLVNIILNTYWLTILYGNSFLVLLPPRILKNIIQFPIDATIFYVVSKSLSLASKRIFN